jgi:hypothetical protein
MPKSTKAIKVSDLNASWNKKNKPSRYRIDTIVQFKSILIVCEGASEKNYFDAFPVLSLNIRVVDLGGQSKMKLVQKTKIIEKSSSQKYDEVWCVFDMDVNQCNF